MYSRKECDLFYLQHMRVQEQLSTEAQQLQSLVDWSNKHREEEFVADHRQSELEHLPPRGGI